MFTTNNQVILDELYDENIQPDEDDVTEYAQFIGIDVSNEHELMWIARQGIYFLRKQNAHIYLKKHNCHITVNF
jgi:hypothetical protein